MKRLLLLLALLAGCLLPTHAPVFVHAQQPGVRTDFRPDGVVVVERNGNVIWNRKLAPTASSTARGTLLLAAITAATADGDVVCVGPGTFDVAANYLDLTRGDAGYVHLEGADEGKTIIQSQYGHATVLSGQEPILRTGPQSDVGHLTLQFNGVSKPWAVACGHRTGSAPNGVRIHDVTFTGFDSDNAYFDGNESGAFLFERCSFNSKFDTLYVANGSYGITIRNCDFNITGPSLTGAATAISCKGFALEASYTGTSYVYDSLFNISGASDTGAGAVVTGIHALATSGTLYAYGCRFRTTNSGTVTAQDIIQNAAAVYVDDATYNNLTLHSKTAGIIRRIGSNVTESSAGTLTLENSREYVFTGSTATWTLPALANITCREFMLCNRGTGNITLNRAGSDNLYDTATRTSLTIPPGKTVRLYNDGTYWLVNWSVTYNNADKRSLSFVVFAPTVDTATGDGKFYYSVPSVLNGLNIVSAHALVVTAGTTNTTDIQIARIRAGTPVDVLSTKLTIDSTETSSSTAAAAAVINTSNDDLATDDILRVDVDAVSTTAAKGLIITLEAAP